LAPTIEPSDPILSPPAVSPTPSLTTDNPTGPADRLLDPTPEETDAVPSSAPQQMDSNATPLSALLHDRFGLGR
jgi:hypothetical protein